MVELKPGSMRRPRKVEHCMTTCALPIDRDVWHSQHEGSTMGARAASFLRLAGSRWLVWWEHDYWTMYEEENRVRWLCL